METTESTGTTQEVKETGAEAKEAATQGQKLGDIVNEEMERHDDPEKGKSDEQGKPKSGQTVNQRISTYATRAKDAEARAEAAETAKGELSTQLNQLTEEIRNIKDALQHRKISPSGAEKAAETAEDAFKKLADGIDLPEELQPFKEHLVTLARQIAETVMSPYKEAQEEREITTYQTELLTQYDKVAADPDFTDLFLPEKDAEGHYQMKPEIEEKAMEIAGENPQLLLSERGIKMILREVSVPLRAAEKVKGDITKEREAVEKAKKGRVETSASTRGTSEGKKKGLLEIVEETVKEYS